MATPSEPPANRSATSLSLLDRARANDPEAWRRLVHLYGPLVLHWGRRAGLSAEDAADLAQDVFRSVAVALPRFHHDQPGDTFRGWLHTITRNAIRDQLRREHPAAVGGTDAANRLARIPDPGPDDSTDTPELRRDLIGRALGLVRPEFEERTWAAFWRTAVEGETPVAVAAELGLKPTSVYQARTRVLRRLREELQGLIDLGTSEHSLER